MRRDRISAVQDPERILGRVSRIRSSTHCCHPGPPLDPCALHAQGRGAGIHGPTIEAADTWIPDRKARAPDTFGFRAQPYVRDDRRG